MDSTLTRGLIRDGVWVWVLGAQVLIPTLLGRDIGSNRCSIVGSVVLTFIDELGPNHKQGIRGCSLHRH